MTLLLWQAVAILNVLHPWFMMKRKNRTLILKSQKNKLWCVCVCVCVCVKKKMPDPISSMREYREAHVSLSSQLNIKKNQIVELKKKKKLQIFSFLFSKQNHDSFFQISNEYLFLLFFLIFLLVPSEWQHGLRHGCSGNVLLSLCHLLRSGSSSAQNQSQRRSGDRIERNRFRNNWNQFAKPIQLQQFVVREQSAFFEIDETFCVHCQENFLLFEALQHCGHQTFTPHFSSCMTSSCIARTSDHDGSCKLSAAKKKKEKRQTK